MVALMRVLFLHDAVVETGDAEDIVREFDFAKEDVLEQDGEGEAD